MLNSVTLALLGQGYSYANLAEQLGISVNTVRNNIRSFYENCMSIPGRKR